jgi:sugar (pentulose or hexulose) kinase
MTRVLALDFGTSGVRAGVYDLAACRMRATAEQPYSTSYPHRGWAEQNPEDWWEALRLAVRQVIVQTGDRDVTAVCVAATASTVVACSRSGVPLRPAILWMDCRAAAESKHT